MLRDRLWEVVEKWHQALQRGSIIMIWRDQAASADIGLRILGETPKDIFDVDGFILTRRKKS